MKTKKEIVDNVDIIGLYKEENVEKGIAIEVKHWMRFNLQLLQKDIKKRISNIGTYKILLYVTSAPLNSDQLDKFQDLCDEHSSIDIKIISQNEICSLLDKDSEIVKKYFGPIKRKLKVQKVLATISIVATVVSVLGILFPQVFDSYQKQQTLGDRIIKVEKALSNINDLEKYLRDLEKEMIDTEKSINQIKNEYKQAQVLKNLTKEQLESLSFALNKTQWYDGILNQFLGFILGVAASILGSIIIDKYKKRKLLQVHES